jgi:quercetin dioxygenase-like cupin family protein
MLTRREMNAALGALATLLSGTIASLRAEPRSPQQSLPQTVPSNPPRQVPALLQQSIGDIADAEVTMLILNIPPRPSGGQHSAFPMHKHSGPVFAYVLEGSVENQVDPDGLKKYNVGDCWYEPAMHVHRLLRNMSEMQAAKLLIFEVLPKGKPAAYPVK